MIDMKNLSLKSNDNLVKNCFEIFFVCFKISLSHDTASDWELISTEKVLTFFLFLYENVCCRYSLEVPHRGTSNEYPQHMVLWLNKKDI